MVELDNLDVKILTHLKDNSRKSFQEIAKHCLTSVPTVKSRVDRLLELGVISKFTIDIDNSKLGISEVILLVNAKPGAVKRIAEELLKLEEIKELYVTSDSDTAIVSRIAGDMQRILAIQDRIDLTDVNNIRIIYIKNTFRKDTTIPLASSSITLTCAYCSKKVTDSAVRKRFDDKDYFFCCNTCLDEFEKKYIKLLANTR
ncbi:transcriptional regulator [Candidatus Methanoperedens nitroreducens]|uniref:Transcriptional regulator n=1 Tax=Candidatus Methanoperedens nitratireducens TaxID=1392998 RepID=A0A062VCL5_9EURY|nr:winged helix-turn-helix transcriptional regulator [Candidatus Methanoperedens nitroreducens]KCZ72985.1 transcriptional regulator [Candidatus Methanoperedens nitroreducens]MDJ1423071.1 winged helix-turn-helix transcriptional regulator [Candidatus Methanoperedens sp.]